MMRFLVSVSALLASCGGDAEIGTTAHSQALGAPAAADVFVLAPATTKGAPLHCGDLAGPAAVLRDDVTIYGHVFSTGLDLRFATLPPVKGGLLVVANGFDSADGSGTPSSYGCAENVAIVAGQVSPLNLVLAPAPL